MDGASNWGDSLARNSRKCFQIAEDSKIRTINKQNHARSKKRIQFNALKKKTYWKQLEEVQKWVNEVAKIAGV